MLKLPYITSHRRGLEIGRGSHGQVYSLIDDPSRVIKYSVVYCDNLFDQYRIFDEVLSLLRKEKDKAFVSPFEWGYLNQGIDSLTCFCTLEKLKRISEDEHRVFHSILSHEDANVDKSFSPIELDQILSGLARGLSFNRSKVNDFYNSITESRFQHSDMHPRNVMKNVNGDFKLIDLDSVIIREKML
jgi:hypothetical protein